MLLLSYALAILSALIRTVIAVLNERAPIGEPAAWSQGLTGWILFLLYLPPLIASLWLAYVYGGTAYALGIMALFVIVLPAIIGVVTPLFSRP